MENSFLLYMDILGTKGSKTTELVELIQYFTSQLCAHEIDYKEILDDRSSASYEVKAIKPSISNFSDHILASFPSKLRPPFDAPAVATYIFILQLITMASSLHKTALSKKILMRGALTEGMLLHDGSSVVGEALDDADFLEKKIAIYPRVVISNELIQKIAGYGLRLDCLHLQKDFDGVYFINYLQSRHCVGFGEELVSFFVNLQKLIAINLPESDIKNIGKYMKWGWLASKFEEALDYHCKNNSNEAVKSQLLNIPRFESLAATDMAETL